MGLPCANKGQVSWQLSVFSVQSLIMKMILKITGLTLFLTACQHHGGKALTHEQICRQISHQLNLNQISNHSAQPTQRAQLLSEYQENGCEPTSSASKKH